MPDGVPAKLDVEPGRAGRLCGIPHPGDIRRGYVVGLPGEVDHGVRDAAVPADLGASARPVRADHALALRHRGDRAEHRADPGRNRPIAHRTVAPLPADPVAIAALPPAA